MILTEVTCKTQNTNAESNITALYFNERTVCTWNRKGVEKNVKAYLNTEVCSKVHTHAIKLLS